MEVNKIYNEDCLVTLGRMEDNSIDLIITSPPYNKNAYATANGVSNSWSAMRGRQIPYDIYSDDMNPNDYENWQKKVISECVRVLKPSGSLFYNHKDILVGGVLYLPNGYMSSMFISILFGIEALLWLMTLIIFSRLQSISIG